MSWRENIFVRYLKTEAKHIIFLAAAVAVFSVIAVLWKYDIRAVIYASVLCAFIGAVMLVVGYFYFRKRIKQLKTLIGDFDTAGDRLPEIRQNCEKEWSEITSALFTELKRRDIAAENKLMEAEDYYTAWAHQVKVPISAMSLILQEVDENSRRDLNAELIKIEQYTDMIMAYVRLDKSGTDYVFREIKLDDLISRVLKKYTGVFIRKKLTLNYVKNDITVLTDEKWLSIVLEQLISNALKYTNCGGITIITDEEKKLHVIDTGIGIPKDDIPRIFEKGFTGINGRTSSAKASGIGLYLVKRICGNFGYSITVKSELGVGSEFTVDLNREKIIVND